jgi:hypothetical protein
MATAFMMQPNGAVPVSRMIDGIDGAVDPGSVVTYAISISISPDISMPRRFPKVCSGLIECDVAWWIHS